MAKTDGRSVNNDRFQVVSIKDLPDDLREDYECDWIDEWTQCCVDTQRNEVLYVDNEDCPEDKYLFRDLGVFVRRLNEVANGG